MEYELSEHARRRMIQREIHEEWVALTLRQPKRIEQDQTDLNVHHALRSIEEADGKVLRVIYNPSVDPARVISVYFDRKMRGTL
jgi:hypothetical protein